MSYQQQQLPGILMSFTLVTSALCLDAPDTQTQFNLQPLFDGLTSTMRDVMATIDDLKKTVYHLSRQTMLQQFAQEENLMTAGDSGIRVVRGQTKGLYNYETYSHIGSGANSIHDHANFNSTLGMGEVAVVMNGVYFRTRHNDYKMEMPSRTSTEYGATEPVPYPEVPPEVTAKVTVEEQIAEMRVWFKAFKNQNTTLRDYTKYFTPVLCYMEGAWTLNEELVEPFDSDRHHLEANSWRELMEKIQFASYSGLKNARENWAYLPTKIMELDRNTGLPVYAQWNYRILCHPLKRDLPISLLVPMEDLTFRVANSRTVEQTLRSRAARFKLYDDKMSKHYQLLDEIFYEIPGKDNLISEKPCQQMTFKDGPMYEVPAVRAGRLLDTCRYHRLYKFSKKGAMGLTTNSRGFNDANFWVAQTNQPEVAPMTLRRCYLSYKRGRGGNRITVCENVANRFSYAFPLEIVYLTPLLTWNPHNFTVHEETGIAAGSGQNGGSVPFTGVDRSHYYMTPEEFYKVGRRGSERGAADTSANAVTVMDPQGQVRKVRASGIQVSLPNIQDLGRIRLRYPINPVNGEGSSEWKELNALKAFIGEEGKLTSVTFRMSWTTKDPPGPHTHDFLVSLAQYELMRYNNTAARNVITTKAQGHTHELDIMYNKNANRFQYVSCEGMRKLCWDRHHIPVVLITKSQFLPEP